MAAINQTAPTIMRRNMVEARTGLSRSTIYAKLTPNPKRPGDFDPTFPKPISLGARAVGWIEAEIDGWLAAQIEKSRPQADKAEQIEKAQQVEKAEQAIATKKARSIGKRGDETGATA